ncbi:hypothetical protein CSB09_04230 [Candidatus Gracilibacteria bacterium]|nr:MAG: hypothetical protein CSB09_04230 [Candidatus Gracilibacteria bacterium]
MGIQETKRSGNEFLDDRKGDPETSSGGQRPQRQQKQNKVVIPAQTGIHSGEEGIEEEDPEINSGGHERRLVIARNLGFRSNLCDRKKRDCHAPFHCARDDRKKEIGRVKKKIQKKICT